MQLLSAALLFLVQLLSCEGDDAVRSQVVDIQVRRTRSSAFELKLSAFGEDLAFRLRRSKSDVSKPVFSPNFTMLVLNADDTALDITPDKESLRASEGSVYVDPKAEAALHLAPAPNGKYQVNGFLGQGRSISSDNGVHTVTLSRYIPTVPDYEDRNRSVQPLNIQGRSWAATVVQPEVLVVVDYRNHQMFKGDVQKITDYFSIFFHSVNNRYATMAEPKISFVITGVLQMNSTSAQPFLERNKVNGNGYDIIKVLDSFARWVYAKRKVLPKHDLVTLITGYDLYIQEANGQYAQGVNGRAYIKGACWFEDVDKKFMGSSVTEDIGGFWDGAWTLAHELAHNLGAFHDGEGDAKECDWSLGHIMSYSGWGGESKFFFSKCSVKSMSNFLKSTGATCLKNFGAKSTTRWNATSLNVGDRLNFTAQCRRQTKNPAAFVEPKRTPDELCRNLACRIPDPNREGFYTVMTLNKPAGDGTSCDIQKTCMVGRCVERTVEEQMETERVDLQGQFDTQKPPTAAQEETDGAVFKEKEEAVKQSQPKIQERRVERLEAPPAPNKADGSVSYLKPDNVNNKPEDVFDNDNGKSDAVFIDNKPESVYNDNESGATFNAIPVVAPKGNVKPMGGGNYKSKPNMKIGPNYKPELMSNYKPENVFLPIYKADAGINANRKPGAFNAFKKAGDNLEAQKNFQMLMDLYSKDSQ